MRIIGQLWPSINCLLGVLTLCNTAIQEQTAVTAHFLSKLLLLFAFVGPTYGMAVTIMDRRGSINTRAY